MIEVAARLILTEAAPVADLVDGRVYFGVRPQDERRACIVLSLVSSNRAHTFDGAGGYTQGRLQVDCFAPTYPAAKGLANAAQDALDNFAGTKDETAIDYIETSDARDVPVVVPQGREGPATYGVTFDARFQIQE